MNDKKVLTLEFKSMTGKKMNVYIRNFKENLAGATIKKAMEDMLATGGLNVIYGENVEVAEFISQAYYSVQVIENIVITNGELQEQLTL